MNSISMDDFLKSDFYITEQAKVIDQDFNKMINNNTQSTQTEYEERECKETDAETDIESPSKKRKYTRKTSSKGHKRESLGIHLDALAQTAQEALSKTVSNKVKRDTTLEGSFDDVDGISDVIKEGFQYIKDRINGFKTLVNEIIGTDIIGMLTQLVKGMNQHVSSGRNVTITYLKKLFDSFGDFTQNLVQLTII